MSDGTVLVRDLVKVFDADPPHTVLRGLDLDVGRSEIVGLIGPSGCGKSTLLGVLSGQIRPTAGTVIVGEHRVDAFDGQQAIELRRRAVGVVRQGAENNLVSHLDARANVELGARFLTRSRADRRLSAERAGHLLDLVGLGSRLDARPRELSGGQQQRVALAAALINEPALVLADEPTSALDRRTSEEVWALLDTVRNRLGTSMLVVSHERALEDWVDRVVEMRDGVIASEFADDASAVVAVVDARGRVGLPAAWLSEFGVDRVRIERSGDALVVRPDADQAPSRAPESNEGM